MTYNKVSESSLKRKLLNKTIDTLKHWVDTKLVFTGRVEVLIENTGNDTVDDVSIKFNKPFEMRPGADTVFLALHYKDADTKLDGSHFRFNHPLYGLHDEFCQDTWAASLDIEGNKLLVAHHAIMRLASVLNEIKDFCEMNRNGWKYFDPKDGIFPYDLILSEEDYNSFKSLFE